MSPLTEKGEVGAGKEAGGGAGGGVRKGQEKEEEKRGGKEGRGRERRLDKGKIEEEEWV